MKFRGRPEAAAWLGEELAAAVQARGIHRRVSAVTPIPLHPFRRMARGFDQSELIARSVARVTGLPLWNGLLVRWRPTRPQSGTPPGQRRANLHGAFMRGPRTSRVRGRAVLLVDDVLSTGSTADEAAAFLRSRGAREVYVATAAT